MADRDVVLKITVDAGGAVRILSGTGTAFDSLGGKAEAAALNASKALALIDGGALKAEGQVAHLASTLGGLSGRSLLGVVGLIGGIGAGLASAVLIAKQLGAEGIRYNGVLEQQQIGLASIIAATTDIVDAQGRTLEGAEKFNAAQQLASGLMKQIQKDALLTTATTEQLVEAFQSGLGPLAAAGLSLDQSRKATLLIVQAASALGVPMEQVAQEVRAIAEGSIDVNARLAKALGITNEQVTAAKEQGRLFEFIVEQTEAFAAAGTATEQSFLGLVSSISDVSTQLAALATAPVFEILKTFARDFLADMQAVKASLEFKASPEFAIQEELKAARAEAEKLEQIIFGLYKGAAEGKGVVGLRSTDAANIAKNEEALRALYNEVTRLENQLTPFGTALRQITDQNASSATSWRVVTEETAKADTALVGMSQGLGTYTTVAHKAAQATEDLAKAQAKARETAEGRITGLEAEVQVLQKAREHGNSLVQVELLLAQTREQLKSGDASLVQREQELLRLKEQLLGGFQKEEEARKKAIHTQEQQAKKATELSATVTKEVALLQTQAAIYDQVNAGTLSYQQALTKLAIAQEATGDKSLAQAGAIITAREKMEAAKKAVEDLHKAELERAEDLSKNIAQQKDLVDGLEAERRTFETEIQIIEKGIATHRVYDDVLRDLAIAKRAAALESQKFAGNLQAEAARLVDLEAAAGRAREEFEKFKPVTFNLGEEVADSFRGLTAGILAGTREAGDVLDAFKDAAIGTFDDLFAETIRRKLNWEKTLSGNLLHDLPALFGAGGSAAGQSLLQGMLPMPSQIIGGLQDVFSALSIGDLGTALGSFNTVLQGIGKAGAGLIGFGLAEGIKGLFGIGGSGEAKLGGKIGGLVGGLAGAALTPLLGPLGPLLGSLGGDLFGSLIGSLFAHKPTGGTIVRKEVKAWLKDLEVSFASEIDSGDYFFEETKKLAKKMFGGDFLKASKQILTDQAGPELAKQLQALGAVITAEAAKKEGKPLEQTATTFGNLLIDNLGIDAIPAAIAEITEKAGFSLASLVTTLNKEFDKGRIGEDFYRGAIEGAVTLFSKDLPEALHISKLALESFTHDGIFSLEIFQRKVEAQQAALAVLTDIAAIIKEGASQKLPATEIAANAFASVKNTLRDSVAQAILDGFVKASLAESALAGPLGVIQEQIKFFLAGTTTQDEFLANVRAAIEAIQPELERLSLVAGELGAALPGMLADVGLGFDAVGDAIDGVSTSVDELLSKITDIDRELATLANRRIQVQVDLVRGLEAIGAVGTTQRIDFEMGGLVDQFNALERAQLQAGRDNLDMLEQQIGMVQQAKQLIIERYNTEEQAIQQALQAELASIEAAGQAREEAIRSSFESQRAALEASFDAQRSALEAREEGLRAERDAIQEAARVRIDALQEELRLAEDFQQAADSVRDVINSIVSSTAFSPTEQHAILERQARDLREQLKSAPEAAQPELIRQLVANRRQLLQTGVFQEPSQNFIEQRDAILAELETLQNKALEQAGKAEQIQADILATQQASEQSLASIDAQIEALQAQSQALSAQQQAQLAALSAQEQTALAQAAQATQDAITQAQAIATANIAALRAQAAQDLRYLTAIEESLLSRQAVLLEAQRATLLDQLVVLVGAEQAQQLLAAKADASLLVEVQQLSLLTQIRDRLAAIVPAQHGAMESIGSHAKMFLAHPGEDVLIGPRGMVFPSAPRAASVESGPRRVEVVLRHEGRLDITGRNLGNLVGRRLDADQVAAIDYEIRQGDLRRTFQAMIEGEA